MKIKEILNKDLTPFFRKDITPILKKEVFKSKKLKKIKLNQGFIFVSLFVVFVFGFLGGNYFGSSCREFLIGLYPCAIPEDNFVSKVAQDRGYVPQSNQEQAVINVVKNASPSVVSVVVTKEVVVYEEYIESEDYLGFQVDVQKIREKGIETQNVGGGTGFIVSKDGLILTNKHVVVDKEATFFVITQAGEKYEAEILAEDPVEDLAILRIEGGGDFPVLRLADSSEIEIGQTVIAIGNALGEFNNTVSVGVISGLGRTITASGGGVLETLEDIIQTDTAINRGNSGGPLLNLKGEVAGINVAMAESAQSIGFAIPSNKAERDIKQVQEIGKIVYPFLGVRYIVITPQIKAEKDLTVEKGVLIVKGDGPAITPGSSAEEVGLRENDIILRVNRYEITPEKTLSKIIQQYYPGDEISLRILREGEEIIITAILGERTSS